MCLIGAAKIDGANGEAENVSVCIRFDWETNIMKSKRQKRTELLSVLDDKHQTVRLRYARLWGATVSNLHRQMKNAQCSYTNRMTFRERFGKAHRRRKINKNKSNFIKYAFLELHMINNKKKESTLKGERERERAYLAWEQWNNFTFAAVEREFEWTVDSSLSEAGLKRAETSEAIIGRLLLDLAIHRVCVFHSSWCDSSQCFFFIAHPACDLLAFDFARVIIPLNQLSNKRTK